ncbi:MAG: hypothetical protein HYS27_14090 [Deltaproteobacteria bacterium]|nr:hypothetical protein [Deltaproteobacteria bacterium]
MLSFSAPALLLVVVVPIVTALALAPLVRAPWPGLRVGVALVAHLLALGAALDAGMQIWSRGGASAGLDAWAGARAEAVDVLGLVPLVLTPTTALPLVAVLLAATGTAVVLAPMALRGRSTALHTALLLATGAVALVVVARRADAVAAAFSLSGLCGFGLLAAALPKRDDGLGAVRAFVLHRIGDVALFAAVLAVGGAIGGVDVDHLLATADTSPWLRATAGPLTGFAAREAWLLAAALVAVAGATRLAFFPLQALVRDAVGLPGAALGFVWGVCFVGTGLIVLLRLSPLLWLAPEVLTVLGAVAVASAAVTAALALAGRELVRIDVLLLAAFGALVALAVAATDTAGAVLGTVCVIGVAVPLCGTTGAVVVVTGRTDPHLLGGVERRMPRTHTGHLLATGALFGPVFAGAVLGAHLLADALAAPWLGPMVGAGVLAAVALLALAAFRPLHLVFTGREPREPLARPVTDPPLVEALPPIAMALAVLGLGLVHLPAGAIALLFPERSYQSPLSLLLAPEHGELHALRTLVLDATNEPSLTPGAVLLVVVGAAAAGLVASTVLYRGGPGRVHRALFGGARAQRVLEALAKVAGRESQVARGVGEGASRLSRLIAANLMPGLLEALLRRLPAVAGTAVGALVRLLANGSAQRGLTVAVLGLLVLAAAWSGLFDLGGGP